jgi:UDP-N-acetyl-alpha-D-muramoyl-L-alanyl-L-glutamate epimerase
VKQFIFKSYSFDKANSLAKFEYGFDDGQNFIETVTFEVGEKYDNQMLNRALFLAFMVIGTSYYKAFPSSTVKLDVQLDALQVDFFNNVYQEGMGQFAFENNLTRDDLAHFTANGPMPTGTTHYNGLGVLALQSGGKDSLLTAELLKKSGKEFTSWYVSSSDNYPKVIDKIGTKFVLSRRNIDHDGLRQAKADGGLNGHVPRISCKVWRLFKRFC